MFKGIPNIIDIEASSFNSDSYPIEVGVILRNGERYCALIQPTDNWLDWDISAEKVHNISRATLKKHGKPIDVVADELNEFLGNENVYSDGWVVDKPWLDKLFYMAKKTPSFQMSSLEMILSEPQMEIWHKTKDTLLAGSEEKRHRASFDAALIQQTFIKTAQKSTN